jgi:hypothetical protein
MVRQVMRLVRDEEGTAITEGAIVMPFFIIILMALMALYHMYDGRIEAQVNSAAKAFKHARQGCVDDPGAVQEQNAYRDDLPDRGRQALDGAAGGSPLKGTHTTGAETVAVTGLPAVFGGPTKPATASQRVLCNMEPKDSVMEAIGEMVSEIADWW